MKIILIPLLVWLIAIFTYNVYLKWDALTLKLAAFALEFKIKHKNMFEVVIRLSIGLIWWKTKQSVEVFYWGRVTHICVGKMIIIGSDNGLLPDRRQAIIWTNPGLLSIGPLRTYYSENLIKIQPFSLKKMHVKTSSAKWRPSCLGLIVVNDMNSWKCHEILWSLNNHFWNIILSMKHFQYLF